MQAYHIWFKYVQWAESPIPQNQFFKQFREMFPREKVGPHRAYRVDPEVFDLSDEHKFVVLKELRKIRENRKEEWKRKRKKLSEAT